LQRHPFSRFYASGIVNVPGIFHFPQRVFAHLPVGFSNLVRANKKPSPISSQGEGASAFGKIMV